MANCVRQLHDAEVALGTERAKVVELRGLYDAAMKSVEYLTTQHEPCEVHHGARRSCGQCLSSAEQHLANERAKGARLEEERAATCLALTGGLNVVLPGKLPDLVRGIYERIEAARKVESAQRATDGVNAMLRQVDRLQLVGSLKQALMRKAALDLAAVVAGVK